MNGLNIGSLVRVSVNLSPIAAARRGFGTLLIIGDSNVINIGERIRTYTTIEGVANDFGVDAPEYKAAALFYGQTPKPQNLMIGRWAREKTSAVVSGGVLTDLEKQMSEWTAITSGNLTIHVDGSDEAVLGLDFSTQTNLNGVVAVINAKLTNASLTWDGMRFTLVSKSEGDAARIGYATSGAVAGLLKLTQETALVPADGIEPETPLEVVQILSDISSTWYGLSFAASVMPNNEACLEISEFIEASSVTHIFGKTETDTRTLDAAWINDFGSKAKAKGFKRTCVQYSHNPYAICSLFGRAFSVNFNANRSTITLMYKQEPAITYEKLNASQAATLKEKNINVFVLYDNDTAIIQWGKVVNGAYFDEVHGLDWLADAMQNSLYNLLYQSKSKVPQTEEGQTMLLAEVANVCEEGVNNGLIAPGTWNADGFGQLRRGNYLEKGYYLFSAPMDLQPQSLREQRTAQPIQVAVKLAGAIHDLDVIVDVNR